MINYLNGTPQLSPRNINLVPAQAGKVTVGLASHWPCVIDNSGITTYGLTALGREMSTPPTLQWNMAHFTFTCSSNRLGRPSPWLIEWAWFLLMIFLLIFFPSAKFIGITQTMWVTQTVLRLTPKHFVVFLCIRARLDSYSHRFEAYDVSDMFSWFSDTIAFACRALENGFVSVKILFVRITKYFDNLQTYEIQLSWQTARHMYTIAWLTPRNTSSPYVLPRRIRPF